MPLLRTSIPKDYLSEKDVGVVWITRVLILVRIQAHCFWQVLIQLSSSLNVATRISIRFSMSSLEFKGSRCCVTDRLLELLSIVLPMNEGK